MNVGVLDTCVVVAISGVDPSDLPDEQMITTITLGELSVGPLVADEPMERARRLARLQWAERQFEHATIPYDVPAARQFGSVMAGALGRGRTSRARVADFQIAAIAIANRLPLYTINVADFAGIDGLEVREVGGV